MIIVNYHNIVAHPNNPFTEAVRTWDRRSAFAKQLKRLSQRFDIVTLDEMVLSIRTRTPIPNACAITFDDGYLGAYRYGVPVLEKLGIQATFFIISGMLEASRSQKSEYFDRLEAMLQQTPHHRLNLSEYGLGHVSMATMAEKIEFMKRFKKLSKVIPVEKQNRVKKVIEQQLDVPAEDIDRYLDDESFQMMGWREIEDLLNRGFSIGSHTRSHCSLSQVGPERLEAEIRGSFTDLTDRFDLDELPFAYPFGKSQHFAQTAVDMVKKSGYYCGLTTIKDVNTVDSDLYRLHRITFRDLRKGKVAGIGSIEKLGQE